MASSKFHHHEMALAQLNGEMLPTGMEDREASETFAQLHAIFDQQQPVQQQPLATTTMEFDEVTHIKAMKEKLKTAASFHTIAYFQPATECGEAFKVEVSKSGAPTSRFKVNQSSAYSAIATQDIDKDSQLSNDDQVGISKSRLSSTPKRSSARPNNSQIPNDGQCDISKNDASSARPNNSQIPNDGQCDISKNDASSAHKQNGSPPKIYVNGNDKYINYRESTRKRRSMLPVKIDNSKNTAFVPSSNISIGKAHKKSDYSAKDDFNRRQKSYGAGFTLRIADDAQELLMGTKKISLQRNKSLPLVPDEKKLPTPPSFEPKKTYVKKSFVPSGELNTSKSFAKGSISAVPNITRPSVAPHSAPFSHLARPTASTAAKDAASKAVHDRRHTTSNNIRKPAKGFRERISGLLAKRRRSEVHASTAIQPDDKLHTLILANNNASRSNAVIAGTELTPPPSRGSLVNGHYTQATGFDILGQSTLIAESIREGGEQLRRLMASILRIEDEELKADMMALVSDCMEAINVVHEASTTLVRMEMAFQRFSTGIQTLGLMTASVASRAATNLD